MKNAAMIRIRFIGLLIILTLIMGISPAFAITWGEIDEENDYQNVCMIGVSLDSPGGYVQMTICSGTLIDKKVVLTAGHCIEYVESLEELFGPGSVLVEVWFEVNLISTMPGTGTEIDEYHIHPDYFWGPNSNPHDVGVLTFAEPFNIEPANLPYQGFLDDLKAGKLLGKGSNKGKLTVVGYGCTVDWPPPVVDYSDSFIRRYAESEYRALLPAWLRLSQNQATDDAGSCFGDSGGPVFWTDGSGKDTLVGITSWGDPHCISPSFNYRVDIPEVLDFIELFINPS